MAKARKARGKRIIHSGVFWAWFLAVSDAQHGRLEWLSKVLRTDFGRSPEVYEAERLGRDMLAAWLERRLTRKRGGQRKSLFNLPARERLARLAAVVRRMEAGELVPISHLLEGSPRKQLFPRGVSVEALLTMSKPPKPMPRAKAIDEVTALSGEKHLTLHNYFAGKIRFKP